MQRWIVIGLVIVVLGMGGSAYALWNYRQNRPAPMWVPMPIRAELTEEKREEIVVDLRKRISTPEILLAVSKEINLAQKWDLPTAEIAADELKKRLFVKAGDMATSTGSVPAILVGINGSRKEKQISSDVAVLLMNHVWKILGIESPKESGSDF